jgi:4,5-dihydroxyphthalate decarboxylase
MDGSVKPEGIDLRYENLFPAATFHRMMGKQEFDASELGLTFYLDALQYDDPPFVAIPVYPIRVFSHSAIYINTASGIESPKDLVGKKIGEFFLYGHDAGTWSKGILSDDYGVPIDSYSNYIGGVGARRRRSNGTGRKPPPNIKVQHIGTERRSMPACSTPARSMRCSRHWSRIRCNEVPQRAAVVSRFRSGRARLFPSVPASSRSARGRDPQDVYRANPLVARSLYNAFVAARDKAPRDVSGRQYASYVHDP